MSSEWQPVSRGLRLILIGAQVVAWSFLATFIVACSGLPVITAFPGVDAVVFLMWSLFYSALGSVLVGRVFCTVGRWICFRVPGHKPRARIRLACVLETCGLGTAASSVLVLWLDLAEWYVWMVGWLVALACLAGGRMFFLHFLCVVADELQNWSLADRARWLFRLSLVTLIAVVVGGGLLTFSDSLPRQESAVEVLKMLTAVVACGLLFTSLPVGLILLVGYFQLIPDVRKAVDRFTPPLTPGDPDRPYRERYVNPEPDAEA